MVAPVSNGPQTGHKPVKEGFVLVANDALDILKDERPRLLSSHSRQHRFEDLASARVPMTTLLPNWGVRFARESSHIQVMIWKVRRSS